MFLRAENTPECLHRGRRRELSYAWSVMAQDSLLVTEGSRTRSTPCCCCRRACSTAAGTPRAALARGRCQCPVTSIRLPARTTRKHWLGRHRQRGARMASGLPRSSLPRRGTAGRVAAMARGAWSAPAPLPTVVRESTYKSEHTGCVRLSRVSQQRTHLKSEAQPLVLEHHGTNCDCVACRLSPHPLLSLAR